jgi:hypothetical protein
MAHGARELDVSVEIVWRREHVGLGQKTGAVAARLVREGDDNRPVGGDARHDEADDRELDRAVRPAVLDVALGRERSATNGRLREVPDLALNERATDGHGLIGLGRARGVSYGDGVVRVWYRGAARGCAVDSRSAIAPVGNGTPGTRFSSSSAVGNGTTATRFSSARREYGDRRPKKERPIGRHGVLHRVRVTQEGRHASRALLVARTRITDRTGAYRSARLPRGDRDGVLEGLRHDDEQAAQRSFGCAIAQSASWPFARRPLRRRAGRKGSGASACSVGSQPGAAWEARLATRSGAAARSGSLVAMRRHAARDTERVGASQRPGVSAPRGSFPSSSRRCTSSMLTCDGFPSSCIAFTRR